MNAAEAKRVGDELNVEGITTVLEGNMKNVLLHAVQGSPHHRGGVINKTIKNKRRNPLRRRKYPEKRGKKRESL